MNHRHKRTAVRRGAAFLLALFVMVATSVVVASMLDTQTMQYMALNNTVDYDRARYLAEAGLQHTLSILEQDILFRGTVSHNDFPPGSGHSYQADAVDGANGTVQITAAGTAGQFTRRVVVTVKMGG